MKPSPSAVGHEATGNRSTGIIEAASTSDSRKTVPRSVAGITDQSGRRHPDVSSKTSHTVAPRNGRLLEYCGNATFEITLTVTAAMSISATMQTRGQSTARRSSELLTIGE